MAEEIPSYVVIVYTGNHISLRVMAPFLFRSVKFIKSNRDRIIRVIAVGKNRKYATSFIRLHSFMFDRLDVQQVPEFDADIIITANGYTKQIYCLPYDEEKIIKLCNGKFQDIEIIVHPPKNAG